MNFLERTLREIAPVKREQEPAARARLEQLTKPPGSLGRLEDLAVRYCLAQGTAAPTIGKKVVAVFAGDHGVAAEGVSAYPKEVTPQMVRNMASGGAAISVLARQVGAEVVIVDVGVDDLLEDIPGVRRHKVRRGTDNLAVGPAMSIEETRQAVEVGIETAAEAVAAGATLLGAGEMGIANTTPAAALLAALLPCSPAEAVGRGTGVDDAGLRRKHDVVERALAVNRERFTGPLETLAAVGGLEIAALCGFMLAAAARRVPTVVDGFISSAAALVALKMKPEVRDYLFFAHRSAEAGHKAFFERLESEPLLDLQMRLGEGTGAALAMSLIEAAVKIYNEMATFSSAGVSGKEE